MNEWNVAFEESNLVEGRQQQDQDPAQCPDPPSSHLQPWIPSLVKDVNSDVGEGRRGGWLHAWTPRSKDRLGRWGDGKSCHTGFRCEGVVEKQRGQRQGYGTIFNPSFTFTPTQTLVSKYFDSYLAVLCIHPISIPTLTPSLHYTWTVRNATECTTVLQCFLPLIHSAQAGDKKNEKLWGIP